MRAYVALFGRAGALTACSPAIGPVADQVPARPRRAHDARGGASCMQPADQRSSMTVALNTPPPARSRTTRRRSVSRTKPGNRRPRMFGGRRSQALIAAARTVRSALRTRCTPISCARATGCAGALPRGAHPRRPLVLHPQRDRRQKAKPSCNCRRHFTLESGSSTPNRSPRCRRRKSVRPGKPGSGRWPIACRRRCAPALRDRPIGCASWSQSTFCRSRPACQRVWCRAAGSLPDDPCCTARSHLCVGSHAARRDPAPARPHVHELRSTVAASSITRCGSIASARRRMAVRASDPSRFRRPRPRPGPLLHQAGVLVASVAEGLVRDRAR